MDQAPFVSVIVPIYNDVAKLQLCLDALERQSYPADAYEVVVVDNASTEDVETVVRSFAQAVYARETTPSSYAARNRGLEVARGDFLAFTDADCIPRPDWLEKGVARLLAHPGCGLVGGEIVLFFKDPERPTPAELYESVYGFNQKGQVEGQVYSVTANLFTFRRVIGAVGPFSAELKSGGDREWSQRVVAAGFPLVYAPEVVIAHPARASFREMIRREQRFTGYTYRQLSEQHASNKAYYRRLAKMSLGIPKQAVRFWRRDDVKLNKGERAQVAFVLVVQRAVRVFELARLRLGGEAHR